MANDAESCTAGPSGAGSPAPEPSPAPYEPIACHDHDRMEAFATRGIECRVEYLDEAGEKVQTVGQFQDIFASGGIEYADLSSGYRIRLDRILLFEPIP